MAETEDIESMGPGAPKRLRRRHVLSAMGLTAGLGALEFASLQGAFDHRNLPPCPGGAERFAQSIKLLESREHAEGMAIHVGHSTHLLSVAGVRVLTDPWFSDPAFGAMSHTTGPAVTPQGLGPLDVIVITHDHADHFDENALAVMNKSATVVVATAAMATRVERLGFRDVKVLKAYEETRIEGATIAAVPAVHDIYEVGFVVRGAGRSVYFAGDTGFQPAFADIKKRYRPQLAILPVDGTFIRGEPVHVMNPDEALRAAQVLGADTVMPSHAEAEFSDPLVKHLLASTIENAGAAFAELMSRYAPQIVCQTPLPGANFALPPRSKSA